MTIGHWPRKKLTAKIGLNDCEMKKLKKNDNLSKWTKNANY